MAVVTVADVLKRAEELERMLADYYSRLSEKATREGVRLLTDYMSRHRVRIAAALEQLDPERVRSICSAPLRYEPQPVDCPCFEGVELPPNARAAEVLDTAVTFDECLISLYRQVVRQPVGEAVKELFQDLIRAEQRDEIELKKIKAMDYF